jgi:hypothetical protein
MSVSKLFDVLIIIIFAANWNDITKVLQNFPIFFPKFYPKTKLLLFELIKIILRRKKNIIISNLTSLSPSFRIVVIKKYSTKNMRILHNLFGH